MKITNNHNVPLALAVGLISDYYDYVSEDNYISATGLLRPTRSIVLGMRGVKPTEMDIIDKHHTFMGNAVHNALEHAWLNERIRNKALDLLGYTEDVKQLIEVNPKEPTEGRIQIYVEPKRRIKELAGFKIGGKPDLILDGLLHDYKTASVFKFIKGDFEDWRLQGSIYRWLYSDLIKEDHIKMCLIFKDWAKAKAEKDPEYPQSPELAVDLDLLSIEDTKKFIRNKLSDIKRNIDLSQTEMIECTDEELWVDPPKYAYYANAAKTDGRSTRNFDSQAEADAYHLKQGKGVVIERLATPKRCNYCDAFDICEQRMKYIED